MQTISVLLLGYLFSFPLSYMSGCYGRSCMLPFNNGFLFCYQTDGFDNKENFVSSFSNRYSINELQFTEKKTGIFWKIVWGRVEEGVSFQQQVVYEGAFPQYPVVVLPYVFLGMPSVVSVLQEVVYEEAFQKHPVSKERGGLGATLLVYEIWGWG